MSVRMALAKLCACACGGAIIGGGAVHVAERRYRSGATGYLDVLIAERATLEREVEWADARTAHAVAVTNLYKALGGGWVPPAAPGGDRS